MKRILTGDILFLLGFATVTVVLGLSQTIVYVIETPQGFVFPHVHNYAEDFYYYLHVMRQGFDGMWKATSRLTPEYNPPQFVNPFFLALGHSARIFHTSLPVMYTLARAIGCVSLVLATYALVKLVFVDSLRKRILAMLIIFSGSYFWYWGDTGPVVAPLVHEWTEFDPIFRLSYIPHHLWSKVLMIVNFLLILTGLQTKDVRWVFLLGIATIVMGFISPVVLPTFVPVILLWFGFVVLRDRQKQSIKFTLLIFIVAFLCAFVVAVYHRIVQNSVPPWTSYLWWEEVQYRVTLRNYIETFGLNLFLFLFSIPTLFRLKARGALLLSWFLTGFLTLFIFAPYIPLTNSRYMGGYQFIPVGIGATITIFLLAKILGTKKYISDQAALLFLAGIVLLFNSIGFIASWKDHRKYIEGNRWNMQVYMPQDIWNAIGYINSHNSGGVVVAPLELNSFIPAFTNSHTVSGHKTITTDYPTKNQELAMFYAANNSSWSKEFLTKYNAKFVLTYQLNEAQEKWFESLGLSMVYNTPSIRIYQRQ